jgi:hypothetical protein
MAAPQKVLNLIETFDRNAEAYLATHFNEAMQRQQFVNPFFKCLGWDMDNEQGYAEGYKDVVYELYGLTDEEIKIVEEGTSTAVPGGQRP